MYLSFVVRAAGRASAAPERGIFNAMMEIIIIILGLAVDQATKYWAMTTVASSPGRTIALIQDVFHFTYVQNSGMAFGLLQGQMTLFYVLTIITVLIFTVFLIRHRNTLTLWLRIAIALLLSGALGNFIDRVWLGYVRDLFDFRLINFYVFNAADACLVAAVIMLMIYILFLDREDGKSKKRTKRRSTSKSGGR